MRWLPRAAGEGVGTGLLTAMQGATLPDGCPHVFFVGEQRLVRNARRHLVGRRGYDREAICFMTYSRLGR